MSGPKASEPVAAEAGPESSIFNGILVIFPIDNCLAIFVIMKINLKNEFSFQVVLRKIKKRKERKVQNEKNDNLQSDF